MTQEEKAKAYDEALKWMCELYPGLHGATKEDAEHYFPELRESEDERIRKHLVAIVEMYWGKTNDPDKAKDLAYLEKQKENPKNADSISADCVSSAKCEDRSPKHTDSFGTDISDTPAYWRGWDDAMKQKEQKSAWSEEDETHLGWIIECLDYWKSRVPYFADKYQSAINWLKSLRPSWKPSEEQMNCLAMVLSSEAMDDNVHDVLTKLYEQLKKLIDK